MPTWNGWQGGGECVAKTNVINIFTAYAVANYCCHFGD